MKLRNGFVSNSSTSSFIVYGIAVKGDKYEEFVAKEEAGEGDVEGLPENCVLRFEADGIEFNEVLFGYEIADSHGDQDLPSAVISKEDLDKYKKIVQDYLQTDEEPKLFIGTRAY